jgi:sialate O-acetylesterase
MRFMRLKSAVWLVAAGMLTMVSPAFSQLVVPSLFSNNMVLQREMPVPIWGSATPGDKVTVTLGAHTASGIADADGRWRVELPSMPAGGPHELTIEASGKTIIINNILIGDVWLCGGQSNMMFALSRAFDAQSLIAADLPGIRLLQVGAPVRGHPTRDYTGGSWMHWGDAAAGFSAVAASFAREIHQRTGVPVGLVLCGAGGTPAESWTPYESMATNPAVSDMTTIVDAAIAKHVELLKNYPEQYTAWIEESILADREGRQVTRPPHLPADVRSNPYRPAGMYNGGIAPLAGLAIKGIIWYQGESNGEFAYQYRELFPALISGWRAAWKRPDLPFLFVQLPTYLPPQNPDQPCSWAELREAQLMTWKRVPHTGMAITIDLGADRNDPKQDMLHPPNKIPMGQRLALVARALVYGEKVVYSGPIYDAMTVKDGRVQLKFTHTGSGLVTKGDGGQLDAFLIAGEDRKFVAAQAKLEGDVVTVWSPDVAAPVAVRYNWAWDPQPMGNLYNREGLPASPFRTDDWPEFTTTKKYWW